jgi:hypothetical protein
LRGDRRSNKWLRLQPTDDGTFYLDTLGSGIDTLLSVYRANSAQLSTRKSHATTTAAQTGGAAWCGSRPWAERPTSWWLTA